MLLLLLSSAVGTKRACFALTLSLFSLSLGAAEELLSGLPEDLSLQQRYELLGYSTWIDASTDSSYNRDNEYARLPETIFTTELRSDFHLRNDGPCEFKLGPRLRFDSRNGDESGSSDETDFYIRSGGLLCAIGEAWELRLGRSLLAWGNATYRGLSNPFFSDNGKTDPIRELLGRDTLLIGYRNMGWSLSTALVDEGDDRNNLPEPGTNALAFRADYIGPIYNAGLIVSQEQKEKLRWGGYATLTASQSLILYGEGTLRRSNGLYPEPSIDSPLGWRYVEQNDRLRAALLLGAAYTFASGWTLTSEVLLDEAGYSSEQRSFAQTSIGVADDVLSQAPGALTAPAAELVEQALQPGLVNQSRHIVFLQLQRSEWANRADFAMRLAWDGDHNTGDLSASLTYFLASSWELAALGLLNSQDSIDGRVLDSSLLLGIRHYF